MLHIFSKGYNGLPIKKIFSKGNKNAWLTSVLMNVSHIYLK